MRGSNGPIGRLLVALALIVQIYAPVGSSIAAVAAATDPFAAVSICAHDVDGQASSESDTPGSPILPHAACDFCVLVYGGGFSPPVDEPTQAMVVEHAVAVARWGAEIAPVVTARFLDHLRGRAPPVLS